MIRQDVLLFMIQITAFIAMYFATQDLRMMFIYGALAVIVMAVILLYNLIYPNVSRLVVNNMCMLITAGMIMITRLSAQSKSPYGIAIRQLVFVVVGIVFGLIVPVLIRKMTFLENWTYIYAAVGGAALLIVALFAATLGGAKLSFNIGPVSLQPSEFVKILFVFFVAASLNKSTEFKNVVVTTAIAAAHVLILVLSTDLGAALIYFIVYLVMLYVATRQPLYAIAGVAAGCGAAVVGYHLFSHIKVRVAAWQDPFATYSEGGYQIAQSLFAIGSGGWFGTGLFRGQPDTIPVAETDLIFSAMTEEMGLIFTLCLILVCVSCYVMFLNIAMELRNFFYKLVALGLGTCYIFQVFLQIGGVTKFIPLTGVTLPFVSYGGSSLLSTMIMFGIIQGLYIVREDEEAEEEHQIEMQRARQRNRSRQNERRRQSSSNAKSGRSRQDGRDRRREYDGDNRDRARQRERDLRNESGRTTGKKTTKSRPRFEDVPEQRQQRQRRTRSEQRVR